MEEQRLICKARKGDDAAFEALIERYRAKIYGICLRFLRTEQDAQDAAQEAMIKIYCSIHKFSLRSSFATWVYSVARNTAMDFLRASRRSRNESYEAIAEQGTNLFICDDITASTAVGNESLRMAADLINLLPKEQRICLILKDIDGYTCEEISSILGLSIGTVKSRLHRARVKLQELFRKNGMIL